MKLRELLEEIVPTPFNTRLPGTDKVADIFKEIEYRYAKRLMNGAKITSKELHDAGQHLRTTGDVQKVAIKDLHPIGPEIDTDVVANMKTNTHNYPTVYKYGGNLFVNDGNHRISKAYYSNQTHVLVRVVDIDKLAHEYGVN